ncbi:hypothetical protein BURC_04864 [Burkholderiaceae bacterium]|nr:hypothetical protein BURC_04864 [Burkholderiaceae bacterium]
MFPLPRRGVRSPETRTGGSLKHMAAGMLLAHAAAFANAEPAGEPQGMSVEASLISVVQRLNAAGSADGRAQTHSSLRGDIDLSWHARALGPVETTLFGHLRFGRGAGVGLRPSHTSSVNSSAFGTGDADQDRRVILAQAGVALKLPMPVAAADPGTSRWLELTFGKLDPFVFFDQNAIADDETTRFLNNALVHNPLLDSGGDTGADIHGFSQGARAAWVDTRDGQPRLGVSIGVFGTGDDTRLSGSPSNDFVIAQLDAAPQLAGRSGTVRLYAWRNGRAADFDGTPAPHSGWGASLDQQLSEHWTVSARLGRQRSGQMRFDRALTLATEVAGAGWARPNDAVGVGVALLRTSAAYRAHAGADAASGSERIGELYYRFTLNQHLELGPDLQVIRRPGGAASAGSVKALGLRLKLTL